MGVLRFLLKWLDNNAEKVVIIIAYTAMAGIIFVEVIRRFVFSVQAPWSTTIPVLLFLWLTWFGASYNIKKRTHLALSEVRSRMPPKLQLICLGLDAVLWIVFASIVKCTLTRGKRSDSKMFVNLNKNGFIIIAKSVIIINCAMVVIGLLRVGVQFSLLFCFLFIFFL